MATETWAQWKPLDEQAKAEEAVLLLVDGRVTFGGWVSPADQGAEPEEEFRVPGYWWNVEGADADPTHYMLLPPNLDGIRNSPRPPQALVEMTSGGIQEASGE